MENPIPRLRQMSVISKILGFCLKNWQLWRALTTIEFNIFCWNFAHVFYLIMSTKGQSKIFLSYLDLELLIKM